MLTSHVNWKAIAHCNSVAQPLWSFFITLRNIHTGGANVLSLHLPHYTNPLICVIIHSSILSSLLCCRCQVSIDASSGLRAPVPPTPVINVLSISSSANTLCTLDPSCLTPSPPSTHDAHTEDCQVHSLAPVFCLEIRLYLQCGLSVSIVLVHSCTSDIVQLTCFGLLDCERVPLRICIWRFINLPPPPSYIWGTLLQWRPRCNETVRVEFCWYIPPALASS